MLSSSGLDSYVGTNAEPEKITIYNKGRSAVRLEGIIMNRKLLLVPVLIGGMFSTKDRDKPKS